jgi:hypothetical protein
MHALATRSGVIRGLDPRIHDAACAHPDDNLCSEASWIAGSSPAMTAQRRNVLNVEREEP